MQEIAVQEILYKLKASDVGFTYSCIANYNNIFDSFKYTNYNKNYNKYKEYYQKINDKKINGGSKNNKEIKKIHLPPPVPVNIIKQKIIYEDESKTKSFEIKYNKINYKFYTYHDSESVYYRLFNQEDTKREDTENEKACLYIIINKNNHICAIQNILYRTIPILRRDPSVLNLGFTLAKTTELRSHLKFSSFRYRPECLPEAIMDDKNGKTLLKLALKLIDTIKDNYKIKYIQLSDHSVKNCGGKEIKLHKMLTLLTGTTWYGKYGFTPIDKQLHKDFIKNNEIVKKTYMKNVVQLKNYIIKSYEKSKSTQNLNKILNNYDIAFEKNVQLSYYLTYFLKKYDMTCLIFYYFYEQLYNDLGLINMGNQSFIKEL